MKIFFKWTFSAFTTAQCSNYDKNHVFLSPGRRSLISNASCYVFCFFAPMLFCCGHAMSQIQIILPVFNSKIKSGLFTVVVFCRWNSKSHTSFALSFSNTVPLSHHCSCQIASLPTNSSCFAQATARIISTQLLLVRYPATRCSSVSECWVHIPQLPSYVSSLASFHDLVSTIYPIVIIAAFFQS